MITVLEIPKVPAVLMGILQGAAGAVGLRCKPVQIFERGCADKEHLC